MNDAFPIRFPLPPPDRDRVRALHKAWARQDLERYLTRWQTCDTPPVPPGFMAYPWRACDLGCGFGKFPLCESMRHPDRAYLGIDKGHLRGGGMVKRFIRADRPNLFGIHCNATPFLATFPNESLDLITIFYPNPWWPRKHRKKRWSYHPLLPKLISLLKPDGAILLTSNEGFYLSEWIFALRHHPELPGATLDYAGPIRAQEGRTHFEIQFIQKRIPCGEVVFKRR